MSSIDAVEQLAGYERWLETQPLAVATQRAYRGNTRRFVEFLTSWPAEGGDPLTDAHARDYAVRDFKSHLKTARRAKPASVNLAFAAVDHFYRYLGAGRPDVRREELAQAAPRALSAEQLQRFMRAVERCRSPRDRAIAVLLVNTGLRRAADPLDPDLAQALLRVLRGHSRNGYWEEFTVDERDRLMRLIDQGVLVDDGGTVQPSLETREALTQGRRTAHGNYPHASRFRTPSNGYVANLRRAPNFQIASRITGSADH